jgi:hypothetical protein
MAAVTAGGGEVEECPPRLVVAALGNDHGRTGIEQVTHQIRGLVVGRVDAPREPRFSIVGHGGNDPLPGGWSANGWGAP